MRRLSLRAVLVTALLLPIVLAVGTTGFVSYGYGQRAVLQLVRQLQQEVSDSVFKQLEAYLQTPHTVNQLNVDALQAGLLDNRDIDALEGHFWRQLRVIKPASFIQLGRADGFFVGVERIGGGVFHVEVTDATGTGKGVHLADARGRHSQQLSFVDGYDARTRPWYRAAKDVGGPTWSPIYQFASRDSVRLGITAVQPYNELQGGFAGVLGTDIVLAQLGSFLDSPRLGDRGQIYIVERSGQLVASSVMDRPFTVDDENRAQRVAAVDGPDPVMRATALALQERGLPDGHFESEVDGERLFVHASTFEDGRGIDWLVVVVLPERAFMTEIQANAVRTLGVCLLALALSGLLALWISSWITDPVSSLRDAADALAAGDWEGELPEPPVAEIASLAASFRSMRTQLQTGREELEQMVALRTADMEDAERARDAAEAANRSKSTFLANMSHELRTPMVAVLGYSEMLIEEAGHQSPEEMVQDLERIHSSGKHLLGLIDEILDLSAIEIGRLTIDVGSVDVGVIARSVISTLRPTAETCRCDLSLQLPPEEVRSVLDPRRLEQCLLNLVANALKFTEGGEVAVRVTVSAETVRLSVADTGIGIPPEHLDRIFEPFTQVDESATRTRGGTGLGLAITRDLVERMGGQISLQSELGVGTTVDMVFARERPGSA